MLISKEELENLERYEESRERLSSRSLRTVLEGAFADREPRQNPEDGGIPESVRLKPEELLNAALQLDYIVDGVDVKGRNDFLAIFQKEELWKAGGAVWGALWENIYNTLTNAYPASLVENVVPRFRKGFLDFAAAAQVYAAKQDERFVGGIPLQFTEAPKRLQVLGYLFRELQKHESLRVLLENKVYASGFLYLLGRLCTVPLGEKNGLPLGYDAYDDHLNVLLLVTADFWAGFSSFEDVADYILDPRKEKQRVTTDLVLTIVYMNFSYHAFIEWRVATGYGGFKRLLPIVGQLYLEADGDMSPLSDRYAHQSAGYTLLMLALLKMPAKQLKGYSKKLKRLVEEHFESKSDEYSGAPRLIIHRAFSFELGVLALKACPQKRPNDYPLFSKYAADRYLAELANTFSGSAGEYVSFASELRQKNGKPFTFDPELLALLDMESADELSECISNGGASLEFEVALAAAILASYPASRYDEIPNLSGRTFDFLQSKILEFHRNKPSLLGPSLIELYLKPNESVSELSYLEWCSNLMEAYAASDGGEWEGFGDDAEEDAEILAKNADQEGIAELALFLEGDEPELISRDFDFTVALRGDGLASFFDLSEMGMTNMSTGLDCQFLLADIYRRAHSKVGGNVDKSLHPKWHEIDGEDGLYFVELPRFHPIWWIIGSTSIANCCMTPNNVGKTSCRSGFWGNRDRSFILVHEPTSTIIGSLQAIGGKLGQNTKGWELVFDGMEFRNSQSSDTKAQADVLRVVKENFEDNENIKAWLRWMLPYLPTGGGGYSRYIDYMENDSDVIVPSGETLDIPQGFVEISDVSSAYRDFATSGVPCKSVNPVSFAGRDFTGVRLEGAELENLDLSYCNFSKSVLDDVVFRDCNLSNAVFERASLEYVYFTGADLAGANFDKASIDGPVYFAGARSLDQASFIDVVNLDSPLAEFPEDFQPPALDPTLAFGSATGVIEDRAFQRISYTEEEFLAKVKDTVFQGADFTGTRFFGSVSFRNCVFERVDFSQCKFESFSFYECRFEECYFHSAELSYVAFKGCRLDLCEFDEAKMRKVDFREGTTLHNCAFDDAHLWDVSFDDTSVSDSRFEGAYLFLKVKDSLFHPNVSFDDKTTFPAEFTQEMFEALGAELE